MQHTAAPTLITDRLRLRAYRLTDFEAFADFYASPRSQYADGPVARDVAWVRFAAGAGAWSLAGYGGWIIELRKDNAAIGTVSLNHPAHVDNEPELGWLLWDGYEGQGYASEAALAGRQFAFEQLGWDTLVSYISPENKASIRLAKRMSAVLDQKSTDLMEGEDTHVYRHSR